MTSCLIESHFLPSLEYFSAVLPHDQIFLEKHEHFSKQSFRNRCYILTSSGLERLTIPLTAKRGKVMITDVQIDNTKPWQTVFWRTITSAYAKAPFFEHYADDLRKEIFHNHKYLFEMNVRLLSMCLQWLVWNKSISESVTYEKNKIPQTVDLRSVISAKKDFRAREFYQGHPYQQVFGNNFVPNLSLIDLVFCVGPNSSALINASRKKN